MMDNKLGYREDYIMKEIEYFKLQAKNLFRDYKTKTPYIDNVTGYTFYKYSPKYFDIDEIFLTFDWDEEHFTLMNAQHLIANIVGFNKWNDLLKATPAQLKLAKLLFDNQDKIYLAEWEMYIAQIEKDNNISLSDESKLEIFQKVFVEETGHQSYFPDFRLNH